MDQLGFATVEFEHNGDFCGSDCPWRIESAEWCALYNTGLKTHKMVDPINQYLANVPPKAGGVKEWALRCKPCRDQAPPSGLYQKVPKRGGISVFPTPHEICFGEWVPCERLHEFRKVMAGWFLRCRYTWRALAENDVEICDVELSARKGLTGKIRKLGACSGLVGLDQLPKDARGTFLVWANCLFDEVVDIEDAKIDALWEADQNG